MTQAAHASKTEFARVTNVTEGRVRQWIKEGKIGPDALVGEGRFQRILIDRACEQLRLRRDVGQSMGNGLDTRLEGMVAEADPSTAMSRNLCLPIGDPIESRIKHEKLRGLEIANRVAAEAELARRGMFTSTPDVNAALTKTAGDMVATFEGALSDYASAIAERFQVPQRDVLHLLRSEFRKTRTKAAQAARSAAERLPRLLASDLSQDAIAEA